MCIKPTYFAVLLCLATTFLWAARSTQTIDEDYISYTADPHKKNIRCYWKDAQNKHFKSIQNLKTWLEYNKQKLVFAMNGGMYMEDLTPVGLYIENGKTIRPLNTKSAHGNFYLQPNGVFFITRNHKACISTTANFVANDSILYATQSGPMLVINGKIHPEFSKTSSSTYVRNGVGILPNGHVLFAMSKKPVNFYNFASYFKEKGCNNALYLDGFVSKTYLPEKNWIQTGGNFGVIIGIAEQP